MSENPNRYFFSDCITAAIYLKGNIAHERQKFCQIFVKDKIMLRKLCITLFLTLSLYAVEVKEMTNTIASTLPKDTQAFLIGDLWSIVENLGFSELKKHHPQHAETANNELKQVADTTIDELIRGETGFAFTKPIAIAMLQNTPLVAIQLSDKQKALAFLQKLCTKYQMSFAQSNNNVMMSLNTDIHGVFRNGYFFLMPQKNPLELLNKKPTSLATVPNFIAASQLANDDDQLFVYCRTSLIAQHAPVVNNSIANVIPALAGKIHVTTTGVQSDIFVTFDSDGKFSKLVEKDFLFKDLDNELYGFMENPPLWSNLSINLKSLRYIATNILQIEQQQINDFEQEFRQKFQVDLNQDVLPLLSGNIAMAANAFGKNFFSGSLALQVTDLQKTQQIFQQVTKSFNNVRYDAKSSAFVVEELDFPIYIQFVHDHILVSAPFSFAKFHTYPLQKFSHKASSVLLNMDTRLLQDFVIKKEDPSFFAEDDSTPGKNDFCKGNHFNYVCRENEYEQLLVQVKKQIAKAKKKYKQQQQKIQQQQKDIIAQIGSITFILQRMDRGINFSIKHQLNVTSFATLFRRAIKVFQPQENQHQKHLNQLLEQQQTILTKLNDFRYEEMYKDERFGLYMRVFDQIPETDYEFEMHTEEVIKNNNAATDKQLKVFLHKHRKFLNLARRAANMKSFRFIRELQSHEKTAELLLPHLSHLRNISKFLLWNGASLAGQGEIKKACQEYLSAYEIALQLNRDNILISHLVANAIIGNVIPHLQQIIPQLSEKQCEWLLQELKKRYRTNNLSQTIMYDKDMIINSMSTTFSQIDHLLSTPQDTPEWAKNAGVNNFALMKTHITKNIEDFYTRLAQSCDSFDKMQKLDDNIETEVYVDIFKMMLKIQQFHHEMKNIIEDDREKQQKLMQRYTIFISNNIAKILLSMVAPAVGSMGRKSFENQTRIHALSVQVALQLWKIRNGSFPQNLSQITATVGKDMLQDPFTKQSFKYHKDDTSCHFWSIGPDLQDNKAQKEYSREQQTGDIIFRVK
ncbi:hypothetical protein [Candidatus Uabimicrobium amorphum]|uniref:Uncharacterized protein n=1 Tax=Uabimicrobium amorphum TaxID=2596890 RepID=A0A5S9F4L9_UABAM|nr:hypothetical protein [Candidatus Uabimicrobium amorphum]BBM84372.1 hypothetical protein UABAM_02731 [Candidatus Uabimicrobium amorphum]